MNSDPIVDEIRQMRERLAARFQFDIQAIVADAQERDDAGDRQIVSHAPRRPVDRAKDNATTAITNR